MILQLPAAAAELKQLAIATINNISGRVYGLKALATGVLSCCPTNGPSRQRDVGDKPWRRTSAAVGARRQPGRGLRLLFVIAVTLMVAVQPQAYREVAIQLMPSFYRRRARAILLQCGEALSSWMVGLLISSLCVGVLAGIGLSLLGVKLVVANALLARLLNVIPNVGPTMSTIFPMAVALLDAPWKSLAVSALCGDSKPGEFVITPSVMHHQVKLLPGLTLTAQFVFTVVFGPLGLLLALPLAVVLQVIIREVIIRDMLDRWKPSTFGSTR